MKRIPAILATAMLFTSAVEALLPPFYESVKEIRAILDDKDLEQKLTSGQAIESISRTDKGYKIVTPKYELMVDVVYEKQEMPGPAKYKLVFHDLMPRALP